MQVVPPSAVLVAWGNAWLGGEVGVDEAVDRVEREHGPQVVSDVDGTSEEVALRAHLGKLRGDGLAGLRLALPVAGDPLGMTGPPELNAAAIEAGEVVLADLQRECLGLVPAPDRRGSSYVGIRWATQPARPGTPDVPLLPEAEQQLTVAMRDATQLLVDLDVPRWHPDAATTLASLRGGPADEPSSHLPRSYSPRAHRVAALAGRLRLVLTIALSDDGGTATATEMHQRREALRDLDRAVRRANVAAHNSPALG